MVDVTCPRCGSRRLIRREARLQRPTWRSGLPVLLLLRVLVARKPQPTVRRRTFLCELCALQWCAYDMVEDAPRLQG